MVSLRRAATTRREVRVSVLYPHAMIVRRRQRHLAIAAGLLAMILSGAFTAADQSRDYQRGVVTLPQATWTVAQDAILKGAASSSAVYSGILLYGALGGSLGVAAGLGLGVLSGIGVAFGLPLAATRLAERSSAPPPYQEYQASAAPATVPVAVPVSVNTTNDTPAEEEQPFTSPPFKGPWNDDIIYLGMNPGPSTTAARKLRARTNITLITAGPLQDRIRFGGRLYDLRTKAGITHFAASLGLPADQTTNVIEAFESCEGQARDELAQLALVWLRAERGKVIPSRLVLAGHSNGDGVWGDNNGSLRLGPLRKLAHGMPHAARQVEDAFVTGCYTGGEVTMDQYRLILPQVKTIWAYEAQAPGVDNGGTVDQAGWETATRGRRTDQLPRRNAKVRKDMAIWSSTRGYVAFKPPLTVDQLRGKVQWMEKYFFAPAFNGKTTTRIDRYTIPIAITDAHTGLVRQYYSWLCRLTQRKDLPEHERPLWNAKKHQTIRLLYYNATVAPRFTQYHANTLRRGYAALKMAPPAYSELRRGQALGQIYAYIRRVRKTRDAKPEAKEVAQLLERGLRDLDPALIPDGWI